MDASEPKQSRVTNTAIQSQLVELSVRLTRMEKDLQEIKSTLSSSGEKDSSLEKSEEGRWKKIYRKLKRHYLKVIKRLVIWKRMKLVEIH